MLFFGGSIEARVAYEISVNGETDAERISGHFDGKVTVRQRQYARNATMLLANGQRIKIQILGGPESRPVFFDVVDPESIAVCCDLI
jgi:hypothetical protein